MDSGAVVSNTRDETTMLRNRVAELEALLDARATAMQKWVQRYEAEHTARVAAERAVVRCSQFMGQTAQDLHTQLAALLEHAQILDRYIKEDTWVARHERASSAEVIKYATRLAKLVEHLRETTAVQHSQFEVRRERLDLVRLVRHAVEVFQPLLTRHAVNYAGSSRPLIIVGDRLRLEEALHNLLEHAIKYSPNGGSVFVRLEPEYAVARLVISTGEEQSPTVDQDLLAQNLGHPNNPNPLSAREARLHIVDQIVTLHGGSLIVENEKAGSSIIVRLPLDTL
jgi:K+-sensing histidine kinase KdpD